MSGEVTTVLTEIIVAAAAAVLALLGLYAIVTDLWGRH